MARSDDRGVLTQSFVLYELAHGNDGPLRKRVVRMREWRQVKDYRELLSAAVEAGVDLDADLGPVIENGKARATGNSNGGRVEAGEPIRRRAVLAYVNGHPGASFTSIVNNVALVVGAEEGADPDDREFRNEICSLVNTLARRHVAQLHRDDDDRFWITDDGITHLETHGAG